MENGRVRSVGVQLALFPDIDLVFLCFRAEWRRRPTYTRTSQPAMLSYQELVALGEQETVDPALAAKLHTLLTTPFVNNEAYYNGVKPLAARSQGYGALAAPGRMEHRAGNRIRQDQATANR